jgi:rhodanese-related sulfurtransferase
MKVGGLNMKKYIIVIMAVLLVSSLVVGCAQNDMTEEKEETMAEQSEKPMPEESEEPKEEMTPVPSETPMVEESEEPMEEEMMIGTKTEAGYIDVTPEEAKKLIDTVPNLVIVDVSPLYDSGHIPGAVNYYVGDGTLDNAIPTLEKGVPYLVYCHSDSASISGSKKLVEAGFDPVYRLIGNYPAWVEAGYPVE